MARTRHLPILPPTNRTNLSPNCFSAIYLFASLCRIGVIRSHFKEVPLSVIHRRSKRFRKDRGRALTSAGTDSRHLRRGGRKIEYVRRAWALPHRKRQPLQAVRAIRDEIHDRVKELIRS